MLQTVKRILRLVTRGSRKIVLNPAESFLILRMATWVAIFSFLVRLRPLPRALELITAGGKPTSDESAVETEQKLARALDLLLGIDLLIYKPICWKRAALLHRYLGLNGIKTQVMFGVRKQPNGVLDGHAWLEVKGKPILEAEVPDYRVTYSFPSENPVTTEIRLAEYDR